ncbi:hypothetical protein E4U55_000004 [Claviceps digitariae]|nr:hypothetical protein E4U55_000004 [Claviceps digitariae]
MQRAFLHGKVTREDADAGPLPPHSTRLSTPTAKDICSGDVPCENCSRRRIACTFAAQDSAKRLVFVESVTEKTAGNRFLTTTTTSASSSSAASSSSSSSSSSLAVRHNKHNAKSTSSRFPQTAGLPPPGRLIEETSRYLSFFDLFAKSNSFTGRGRTTGDEVKQLAELHSRKGNHVLHAMLAVGGMFADRRNLVDTTARRETALVALQHYSYSIAGLRDAIDGLNIRPRTRQKQKVKDEHVCILWTTLLLGLFELMNDPTGHGWQRHIIHGTCMALQASGPSSCRSGPAFAFFTQARIFEISRTILYNERTFLSEPGWVALSRGLSVNVGGGYTWSPLDSLLDIMVMCSDLRVRAATLIQNIPPSPGPTPTAEAIAISNTGFKLQEALQAWQSAYLPAHHDTDPLPVPPSNTATNTTISLPLAHDPSILLSRIFHASISIYLSGIFDYHLPQWHTLGLPVLPTLNHHTLTRHLHHILLYTSLALDKTPLSPLLFLFPLRIAGARSHHDCQRQLITSLVARIKQDFAVAGAIEADLDALWKWRALHPQG